MIMMASPNNTGITKSGLTPTRNGSSFPSGNKTSAPRRRKESYNNTSGTGGGGSPRLTPSQKCRLEVADYLNPLIDELMDMV